MAWQKERLAAFLDRENSLHFQTNTTDFCYRIRQRCRIYDTHAPPNWTNPVRRPLAHQSLAAKLPISSVKFTCINIFAGHLAKFVGSASSYSSPE